MNIEYKKIVNQIHLVHNCDAVCAQKCSLDCSRKATRYVIRRSFWINFQSEKIKSVPYWGKSNAAGHSFNRMYNEVIGL